jgi:lipoate-protein ligase A
MRLLDLGTVPWIRSQSVHHAVAGCFTQESPDTVVLVRPDRPYLCEGHHGIGPPLSPAALRRGDLPVVRRRLGGGTVLVTPAQTFYVLVVHRRRLPLPDSRALRWCLGPAVAAYRRLGVAAEAGPATDVSGGGRKLCGSGAATIGEAAVFGGNVIADFDPDPFLAVLRLPSEAARRLVGEEVRAQIGSVRLLTGALPGATAVDAALRAGIEEACEARLVPGALSGAEEAAIPAAERWLRRRSPAMATVRPDYWKVRAGCGVLRLVLTRPRRSVVLFTVRDRAIAGVTAERPAGRGLATRLATALEAHPVDAPVDETALVEAGLTSEGAAEIAVALWSARRLIS